PIKRESSNQLILIISVASFLITSISAGCSWALKSFFLETRYIPSGSMLPTLQIGDRLIIDKWSYQLQTPQRGDLAVFNPTEALQAKGFQDAFIARIIGLPGEKIEVKNGKVYINNQTLAEPYIAEPPQYQWGPVQVPQDAYVVLGDNRNNSYDSHYWGFVPREHLIGKVSKRFWPLDRTGPVK
ncbi:MAG TPA: signal peptidase I, partial [Allocoleopsis sp.]